MAKAPVPGRVKTRLCPPLTPEQAAGALGARMGAAFAAAGEPALMIGAVAAAAPGGRFAAAVAALA
jgi:hypothetical protein